LTLVSDVTEVKLYVSLICRVLVYVCEYCEALFTKQAEQIQKKTNTKLN